MFRGRHYRERTLTLQDKFYNKTIALAGIIQAVYLVKDLAQTGKAEETAYTSSIYSIFQTAPQNLPAVYNGLIGIKFGLEKLINLLDSSTAPLPARYMLALMRLQSKLARSPKLMQTLAQRIEQAKKQVNYFSLTHSTVIASLADIYLNIITQFKFRIIIWGGQRMLSTTETLEKIRALLLAGVRSAVLWRQMGGSRLDLLFLRSKIKTAAKKILADIAAEEMKLNQPIV